MSETRNDGWGTLYCLSNEAFKGLYKIGFTFYNDPNKRLKELYTTGVPSPFKIEIAKLVRNPSLKEKDIHNILKEYRHNPSREFFNVSLDKIRSLFNLLEGDYYNEIPVIANITPKNVSVTDRYPRTKQEWVDKCKKNFINSVEIYNEKCILLGLPEYPNRVYPGFTNITDELGISEIPHVW
jgi:hypothetical protein